MTMKQRHPVLYALPLLLFAVLLVPYSWLNQAVIVDIFGCGCPKLGADGVMLVDYFNANDFTALFWLGVSACATVWAAILSRSMRQKWGRAAYVLAIAALSVGVSYWFWRMMLWN